MMWKKGAVIMASLRKTQPMEILLVEDNSGDIELIHEAFEDAKTLSHLHIVYDGEEALDFLYRRGEYFHSVRPDLILLDLNMPKKSGREVLAIIKQDSALQDIPVIVLTSSEAEPDVLESYTLHANAYIVKPSDLMQFMHVVEAVEYFWLHMVKLPPQQKKRG